MSGTAIPNNWITATVAGVAQSIQYGHTASALETDTGPRFLRITDIQAGRVDWASVPSCNIEPHEVEKYRLQPGDVVFARTGATTGKSFLIGHCPPAVFASYLIRLRMKDGVVPAYLYFYFQSTDYWRQIEAGKRGIGQPNVNATTLGRIAFPLAPVPQQRRVVAKIEELFSDLDAAVAALQRVRANLKRYRGAVLKAAVEGRLTESWRRQNPPAEPADLLLARILDEQRKSWERDQLRKYADTRKTPPANWRNRYADPPAPPAASEQARIPSEWCWATTEQLGKVQLGRQRSPRNRSKDHSTKYIRAANITEQGLDLSDLLDMEFLPSERATYELRRGDIVLSEASGSADQVGKPALWADEVGSCCFQNTVIRLRPHGVNSAYLLVVFMHFYFNKVFSRIAAGVGINHLSAGKFSKIAIPVPPLDEQQEIVNEVERHISVIRVVESGIAHGLKRAARLRQGILKRAFNGKLVPQDPADEPAQKLVAQMRKPAPAFVSPVRDRQRAKQSGRPCRTTAPAGDLFGG
jgi:type I restriction enzyme S subunit